MTSQRVGIVVLAAGAAMRFGASKLCMPMNGVPLIRRAVLAGLGTGAPVIVVTGAHRELVEPCIADLSVERVFNANWADGMGASIAGGIAALGESCNAAIIALADQAYIGTQEFKALIAAHASAPERIVAAQHSGVLGAPCLFPRAYFDELVALRGERGARALLQRHADQVDIVPMPSAAIDIDTREDYAGIVDV
jgi:molybdenum cofactor cytidylyltransferase